MIEIKVKYLPDTDRWELLVDITLKMFNGDWVTIPKGFITDFATVPWYMRWLVPKTGKHNLSTIVHDWLYQTGYFIPVYGDKARITSDLAQRDINQRMEVGDNLTRVIYYGGRLFGLKYWNRYNKK